MIKTHNVTGLKYLCKCSNRDPYKYKGSGVYWKRHLKEHGRDINTEVIFSSEDLEEFSAKCLEVSIKLDVKNSDEWANLIEETGLDGGVTHRNPHWLIGFKHSEETKRLISDASKNMKRSPLPEEARLKISEKLKGKPMLCSPKGKPKSDEHREKLSKARKGMAANFSQDGLERMKQSVSVRQKIKYKCSVCGKIGNTGHFGRFHKECMKELTWNKIEVNNMSVDQ
jgi:hypothetical protein